MNNKKISDKSSGGLSWRLKLAIAVFAAWVVASVVILCMSRAPHQPPAESESSGTTGTVQPKEPTQPFSTAVDDNGKRFLDFKFPPTIAVGSIGTFTYRPLATINGRTIYSFIDGDRNDSVIAQGQVRMPANKRLSFIPGEMLAVNPSSLSRFRPGEIYDITMHRVRDIDIDVWVEACAQIKGVTRLDLSTCNDLTGEGASFLDGYENLKELQVFITSHAMPAVEKLSVLSHVSSLGLFCNNDIYPILSGRRTSLNLKALKVQTTTISNDTLNAITTMPMLEELILSSDMYFNPESVSNTLKIIKRAPRLKVLALESPNQDKPINLSAADEQNLKACKTLLIVRLNKQIKITPAI